MRSNMCQKRGDPCVGKILSGLFEVFASQMCQRELARLMPAALGGCSSDSCMRLFVRRFKAEGNTRACGESARRSLLLGTAFRNGSMKINMNSFDSLGITTRGWPERPVRWLMGRPALHAQEVDILHIAIASVLEGHPIRWSWPETSHGVRWPTRDSSM